MADRYRGKMYVGVTADLARRVIEHREGTGSDFCKRYGINRLVWAESGETIGDCIGHEKRVKPRRRKWKSLLSNKPAVIGATSEIGGGFNGWSQHFILEGEGVWA